MFSPTEENYLKAIYLLTEKDSARAVATNELSAQMNTRAASVTDMLKRLADKRLIHYKKYKGVMLTTSGKSQALAIVRKHRLWEYFLVEKLKFQWDEVHAVAEELEHVKSEALIDKLDSYLNNPKFDPHGDPIPDRLGKLSASGFKNLTSLKVNEKGKVAAVIEQQPAFLKHLDKLHIHMSTPLKVIEHIAFDKSMTISINQTATVNISHEVAKNILITK
ncbi:MAG: metal-dependent transcriptional regulator [Chitinophagales bacterium]|nr:metal-dependent transcriptional regulator [Chitinophagaceae bacterium]MBP9882660.1 metal-dependent transcriptional regulator [Chitinophagales bacterium]